VPSIYDKYKPLRNCICKYEYHESLEVCWNLSNYLLFKKALPSNIELPPKVRFSNDPLLFRLQVIHEWELEFLVMELLLYSPYKIIDKKYYLSSMNDRARVVNRIRELQDFLTGRGKENEDVFLEMNRIAHQQFPWQSVNNILQLYRYKRVFGYPALNTIIENVFNLSVFMIYRIGFTLSSLYMRQYLIPITIISKMGGVPDKMVENFLTHFATSSEDIKKLILENRKYDETLIYSFNPLRSFPIIENNGLICPIPTLLNWRITSGLYYSICRESGFDKAYGESFQEYLSEIITKANQQENISVYPEKKYGAPEKSTADIILCDSSAILLIECKTKRMVLNAKMNIADTKDLENDLNKLSVAFLQLYKTAEEYKQNKYPHVKYDKEKKIFIMVVTLENWYIGYNPLLWDKLRSNIKELLNENDIDNNVLTEIRYLFHSAEEFEKIIQIITDKGISYYCEKFLDEKGFDAFSDFQFKEIFREEAKNIFFENNGIAIKNK